MSRASWIDLTSSSSIFKIQNVSYKLSFGHSLPALLLWYNSHISQKQWLCWSFFILLFFLSKDFWWQKLNIFSVMHLWGFFWLTARCSRFFSRSLFFSLCLLMWQLKLWSGPFRFLLLCHKRFSLSASTLSSLSTVCHTSLTDSVGE